MKILMMGPQGSGKGTIGEMLSRRLNIPIISTGQTLREMPSDHPRFHEVQQLLLGGNLAPQDLVAEMLREKVSRPEYSHGYIIDGWGRAEVDLKYFDPGFDKVLYLSISPETSIKRLSSRRVCKLCGRNYNLLTVPPKNANVCDICGGELIQRDDDKEDAIKKRLDTFYKETTPVVEALKQKGILSEINAEVMPPEVYAQALAALGVPA